MYVNVENMMYKYIINCWSFIPSIRKNILLYRPGAPIAQSSSSSCLRYYTFDAVFPQIRDAMPAAKKAKKGLPKGKIKESLDFNIGRQALQLREKQSEDEEMLFEEQSEEAGECPDTHLDEEEDLSSKDNRQTLYVAKQKVTQGSQIPLPMLHAEYPEAIGRRHISVPYPRARQSCTPFPATHN